MGIREKTKYDRRSTQPALKDGGFAQLKRSSVSQDEHPSKVARDSTSIGRGHLNHRPKTRQALRSQDQPYDRIVRSAPSQKAASCRNNCAWSKSLDKSASDVECRQQKRRTRARKVRLRKEVFATSGGMISSKDFFAVSDTCCQHEDTLAK